MMDDKIVLSRNAFENFRREKYGFCNSWVSTLQSYECQEHDAAWEAWQAAQSEVTRLKAEIEAADWSEE